MIEIADVSELREHVGRELAVSDWFTMTQERVAQFADATGDHQWIHLDQERARRESPYGTTIAHGFLSLSLISALVRNAVAIGGLRLSINYGLNRVRFVSAVPAGARIRARVTPAGLEEVDRGASQVVWHVVVEREGAEKPCVVADWIVRYYTEGSVAYPRNSMESR
jgi:acyl dehydratase